MRILPGVHFTTAEMCECEAEVSGEDTQDGDVTEVNESSRAVVHVEIERRSQMVDTENAARQGMMFEPKYEHEINQRPTHRCLIVSDYVQVCVDEATLLNEEDFVPSAPLLPPPSTFFNSLKWHSRAIEGALVLQ
ncbi:hypothetical protein DFH05DRAFT_1559338 [Lentinula detonsa]|uniref:Uncharacterized protein n=1 Tax=Lentinula detonsa TaxID=2804962 RepID=A0A9W8TUX5_9AGAR|nr:hypothetical protein DFH05DRAFT_1559338 [Lentinula detonsa]